MPDKGAAGHQGAQAGPSKPTKPASAPPVAPAGPTKTMLARMSGPSDLKAGVGGKVTAEEVQQVIYDASKGGKYFNDQERRDKELAVKSARLQKLLAEKEREARGDEAETVDRILEQLEEKRDLTRVIALIDADAFYAACHQREDPSLEGKAFGVGGGMLTTASYEARKYGCRSAMPLFLAKKLCPHLISLKLEPALYTKASKEIMTVLAKYGPIAPASLDEAYVDMTDYCANEGVTPAEAITRLRAEVHSTTGLTVSAGVSPNKALSKIAADINKPDGQFVVDHTREACMQFIADKRLRKCYGIGRVTEVLLNAIGFEKVEDLFLKRDKLYLVRDHLGQSATFRWLLGLYLGLGSTRVVRAKRGDRKSYGVEKTFTPTDRVDVLEDTLRRVAKALAKDVQRAEFSGRTITLKIKHDNYEAVTRAFTPGKGQWIYQYREIYEHALRLFRKEQSDRRAALARGDKVKGGTNVLLRPRLLGLRLSNLRDEREVKKESGGLDAFVRKTASTSSSKSKASTLDFTLSSSSDDDDSGLERDDPDSDADNALDGDLNPAKRALEQLKQDAALAEEWNSDAEEDGSEHGGASGGGMGSGRWMCVDEEVIIAEGREEAGEKPKKRAREERSTSVASTSTLTSTTSTTTRKKRPASPSSLPNHEAWKDALSLLSSSDDEAAPSAAAAPPPVQKKPRASSASASGAAPPEPSRSNSNSNSGGGGSGSGFTCPICQKEFLGSEAAMSGHVEKCLKAADKPKKAKGTLSSWGTGGGGGGKKAAGGAQGKRKG